MFRDKVFYSMMSRIAVPIIVQNVVSASLNFMDVIMLGQMGETTVAAVGLANQLTFLLTFVLFGVGSGSAVFAAQYWGKKDIVNIRKVLGIGLGIGLSLSVIFFLISVLAPRFVLGIYSTDLLVVNMGGSYLQVVGWSYIPLAITYCYAANLRSTENVRLPMIVSACALTLKTFLNYSLIFGNLGMPQMGIHGAALATVISRLLESGLLLHFIYAKKYPSAASLREMTTFSFGFFKEFLKTSMPVVFNEGLWGLGMTTYSIIYAHIGTEAIAAVNIAGTVENLAFVIFIGITDATAIMVGNKIGAGEEQQAYSFARRSLLLGVITAVFIGLTIIFSANFLLSFYNISESSRAYVYRMLVVLGSVLWIRVTNMDMIVGVFRSGGDTRFALFLDAGAVWLVGVPLAYIGAFVLDLPVYWVYLMVTGEELTKFCIGLVHFFSKKWINNLASIA